MKKLFTLFTMVLMAVSCFATDYKGDLTVTVQPILENQIPRKQKDLSFL